MVEFDAVALADAVLEVARAALAEGGPVEGVGVTTQRASTILWDRATGVPLGPAIGWQDLRTVFDCLTVKAEHGITLAPNQTATKAAWLLNTYAARPQRRPVHRHGRQLGGLDPHPRRGPRDRPDERRGDRARARRRLGMERARVCLRRRPDVDAARDRGLLGTESPPPRHSRRSPITALVGDQQGSLVGQSCVRRGHAKITFGTGGMLDVVTGDRAPTSAQRNVGGHLPGSWRGVAPGEVTWGAEGIMLSAGTNVEWLCAPTWA